MEARIEVEAKRSSGFNLPSGDRDPVPNALDEGMWAAAAEGRLVVQRCHSCRAHRFPPTRTCYRCRSTDWSWDPLPGTGVIATYTWVRDGARTGTAVPGDHYNVIVVDLDGTEGEPVRMVSNVVDAWGPEDIAIGMGVELVTLRLADGIGLPLFRRSIAGESS